MMTPETIKRNSENFKKQLSNFIDFSEGKALMLDNSDWLLDLKYVDFLRNIGVHFSVNRMLTFLNALNPVWRIKASPSSSSTIC